MAHVDHARSTLPPLMASPYRSARWWQGVGVEFVFDAELWRWEARSDAGWTFVSVPADASEEIRDLAASTAPRGFGAVRVEVQVGLTTWRTSVFPDAGRGVYVLPVKGAVRRAQGWELGGTATVHLRVLAP
jgi:hypothetical protein